MKEKSLAGLLVIILLLTTSCEKTPEKSTYLPEEIKEVEDEFIGDDPFSSLKNLEKKNSNYTFFDISFYHDEMNFSIDKEGENFLVIHPSLLADGNYSITIGHISLEYYYEIEDEDSIMAGLELKKEYRSRLGDNQLSLNSMFKAVVAGEDAYGVYYQVEERSSIVLVYLVVNKDIYSFELIDNNNPDDIRTEKSFLALDEILRSLEYL